MPPPPVGPGPGSVYQKAGGRPNLLGWLSLIFGVIATGCCCCWFLDGAPFIGGIPAVVLGALHLSRIRKGQATMAWLGWVGIILAVIAMATYLYGGLVNGFDWRQDVVNNY